MVDKLNKLSDKQYDFLNKLELFAIDVGWILHAKCARRIMDNKEYDEDDKKLLNKLRNKYIEENKK